MFTDIRYPLNITEVQSIHHQKILHSRVRHCAAHQLGVVSFPCPAVNLFTIDDIDPYGKIPEFKFCAVRIRKVRKERR